MQYTMSLFEGTPVQLSLYSSHWLVNKTPFPIEAQATTGGNVAAGPVEVSPGRGGLMNLKVNNKRAVCDLRLTGYTMLGSGEDPGLDKDGVHKLKLQLGLDTGKGMSFEPASTSRTGVHSTEVVIGAVAYGTVNEVEVLQSASLPLPANYGGIRRPIRVTTREAPAPFTYTKIVAFDQFWTLQNNSTHKLKVRFSCGQFEVLTDCNTNVPPTVPPSGGSVAPTITCIPLRKGERFDAIGEVNSKYPGDSGTDCVCFHRKNEPHWVPKSKIRRIDMKVISRWRAKKKTDVLSQGAPGAKTGILKKNEIIEALGIQKSTTKSAKPVYFAEFQLPTGQLGYVKVDDLREAFVHPKDLCRFPENSDAGKLGFFAEQEEKEEEVDPSEAKSKPAPSAAWQAGILEATDEGLQMVADKNTAAKASGTNIGSFPGPPAAVFKFPDASTHAADLSPTDDSLVQRDAINYETLDAGDSMPLRCWNSDANGMILQIAGVHLAASIAWSGRAALPKLPTEVQPMLFKLGTGEFVEGHVTGTGILVLRDAQSPQYAVQNNTGLELEYIVVPNENSWWEDLAPQSEKDVYKVQPVSDAGRVSINGEELDEQKKRFFPQKDFPQVMFRLKSTKAICEWDLAAFKKNGDRQMAKRRNFEIGAHIPDAECKVDLAHLGLHAISLVYSTVIAPAGTMVAVINLKNVRPPASPVNQLTKMEVRMHSLTMSFINHEQEEWARLELDNLSVSSDTVGVLHLSVLKARDLRSADLIGQNDAYCKVDVLGEEFVSDVVSGKIPVWQDERSVHVAQAEIVDGRASFHSSFAARNMDTIKLSVWDEDKMDKDDLLGDVVISIANGKSLPNGTWYQLTHTDSKGQLQQQGEVLILWRYEGQASVQPSILDLNLARCHFACQDDDPIGTPEKAVFSLDEGLHYVQKYVDTNQTRTKSFLLDLDQFRFNLNHFFLTEVTEFVASILPHQVRSDSDEGQIKGIVSSITALSALMTEDQALYITDAALAARTEFCEKIRCKRWDLGSMLLGIDVDEYINALPHNRSAHALARQLGGIDLGMMLAGGAVKTGLKLVSRFAEFEIKLKMDELRVPLRVEALAPGEESLELYNMILGKAVGIVRQVLAPKMLTSSAAKKFPPFNFAVPPRVFGSMAVLANGLCELEPVEPWSDAWVEAGLPRSVDSVLLISTAQLLPQLVYASAAARRSVLPVLYDEQWDTPIEIVERVERLLALISNRSGRPSLPKTLAVMGTTVGRNPECEEDQLVIGNRDALEKQIKVKTGKTLNKPQVRAMVRLQLESDGRASGVPDTWIDKRLFEEFDADGNGWIDDKEWENLVAMLQMTKHLDKQMFIGMVRIQLELDDKDVSAVSDVWIGNLFDEFDADASGLIDDKEWLKVVTELQTRRLGDAPVKIVVFGDDRDHGLVLGSDDPLDQLWLRVDKDGDGELGRPEIKELLTMMGRVGVDDHTVDVITAEMDADGDGDVDMGEFEAWYNRQKDKEVARLNGLSPVKVESAGACAQKKGIKKGMRVLSINRKSTSKMPLRQVNEILRSAGRPLTMEFDPVIGAALGKGASETSLGKSVAGAVALTPHQAAKDKAAQSGLPAELIQEPKPIDDILPPKPEAFRFNYDTEQRLRAIFKAADANGDGELTKQELTERLKQNSEFASLLKRIRIGGPAVETVFSEMDVNDDDSIDADEFVSYFEFRVSDRGEALSLAALKMACCLDFWQRLHSLLDPAHARIQLFLCEGYSSEIGTASLKTTALGLEETLNKLMADKITQDAETAKLSGQKMLPHSVARRTAEAKLEVELVPQEASADGTAVMNSAARLCDPTVFYMWSSGSREEAVQMAKVDTSNALCAGRLHKHIPQYGGLFSAACAKKPTFEPADVVLEPDGVFMWTPIHHHAGRPGMEADGSASPTALTKVAAKDRVELTLCGRDQIIERWVITIV